MQQVLHTADVALHPKSKKELAAEYGVHRNTMSNWCQQLGIARTHRRLTVPQLQQFYQLFGLPGRYSVEIHGD